MSFSFCDRFCKPSHHTGSSAGSPTGTASRAQQRAQRARHSRAAPPPRQASPRVWTPAGAECLPKVLRVREETASGAPLPPPAGGGAPLPPLLQQLGRPLQGDPLDRVAAAQARVRLAVGDVGTEPALLDDDRLAARRIRAELPERRRSCAPPARARLREQRERVLERDREQLLLARERARLLALLHVRAVAAVGGDHLLAVGLAERPRQRQQPQRVLEGHGLRRHRRQERGGARLAVAVLRRLGHVRAVAAGAEHDRAAGGGIDAELALLRALREQLLRALERQLVGGELGRQRLPAAVLLEVRAVAADADHYPVAELDRVDRARVDLAEVVHQPLQALLAVVAEVEAAEPRAAPLLAARDAVEVVLHACGELVVDEPAEVLLEQVDDREGEELRHERLSLPAHVAAVDDRAHDRRVRRRPADAALLERLDERRLRVARRRRRRVSLRLERGRGELVADRERRQLPLLVARRLLLVPALLVGEQEAAEGDHRAGGAELDAPAVAGRRGDPHRHRLPPSVRHLRGDRALPDQLVQPQLVAAQLAPHLVRRAEAVARRPNRLVRLLGVLHAPLVPARLGGYGVGAVERARLLARGRERRLAQRRRVGAHVGDEPVLVQPLRDAHRLLRRQAQLAARLLLQRRRHERRRGPARVRLLVYRGDAERRAVQRSGEPAGIFFGELHRVVGRERPAAVEVAPLRDASALDGDEPRAERPWIERPLDVPVGGGDERHPLALALDDQPRGDRLHASRGEALHHLAPEHRRHLVAIEAVEDAPRLLGVDEPVVDAARLLERVLDRRPRDLVEHHAPHRHLRLQHLDEMPGDSLALAVLVRREQQLVGLLQLLLQVGDDLLLARVDDVERLEVVLDVDAEARPRLALAGGGDLRGAVRQVADVADGRLDHVARAEVARDRLRLRRALHDHQSPPVAALRAHAHPSPATATGRRSRPPPTPGAAGSARLSGPVPPYCALRPRTPSSARGTRLTRCFDPRRLMSARHDSAVPGIRDTRLP